MSNNILTKEEQLLLKEYELRAGQMLHEDKLRHQLVTFIITLSTAVIGGLAYLSQFYCYSQLKPILIIFDSLLIIIIIFSIIIIAKIRKAQLLSMNICENIRDYFYKENYLHYSNINILPHLPFPFEPRYFKPSQTLCFVYLLSSFNSCLIIYLLNIIKTYLLPNILEIQDYILWIIVFFLWIIVFIGHIYLFKRSVEPDQIKSDYIFRRINLRS